MGFGCNVPAIMASRTIESRNSRMITMLVNPLMSCSARLPVYVLLTGAFFPDGRNGHADPLCFGYSACRLNGTSVQALPFLRTKMYLS